MIKPKGSFGTCEILNPRRYIYGYISFRILNEDQRSEFSAHLSFTKHTFFEKKHREKIERKGTSTPTSFWGDLFVWLPVEDSALQQRL